MSDEAHRLFVETCCELLGCGEEVIEALDERGQLGLTIQARHAIIVRGRQRATPSVLLEQIRRCWGTSPFVAKDVLAFALASPLRRDLLAAIREVCGSADETELSARRLGMQLHLLEERPPPMGPVLECMGSARGAKLYLVRERDLQD